MTTTELRLPTAVEAAIDAHEQRITTLVTSTHGRAADDAARVDAARHDLRVAIARTLTTAGALIAIAAITGDVVEFYPRVQWCQVRVSADGYSIAARRYIAGAWCEWRNAALIVRDMPLPARLVAHHAADTSPESRGPIHLATEVVS